MKLDQLQDYLNDDLAWRKMELSQLLMIFDQVKTKKVIIKSIILLLYAHWEGFIKKKQQIISEICCRKRCKIKILNSKFSSDNIEKNCWIMY